MVRSWFSAEKEKDDGVAAVGFVRLVFAAAMGCLFGCFRIRESRSRVISAPAKFLKECGTLPETPVEIRKASANWVDTSAKTEESLNFNSWLPTASFEQLKLGKQPDQSPPHVEYCEESATETSCLLNSPSSCMTDGHDTRRISISPIQSSDTQNVITDVPDIATHSPAISSISPEILATSLRGKNKSVRFEFQSDNSIASSETSSQRSKSSRSAGNSSESKHSPYPTPLKLTDEMQTPGTLFPAYSNNMVDGKANRVRSQYVYSVLNPIENPSMWVDLKNQDSEFKPNDEESLISIPMSDTSVKELSVGENEKSLPDDQNGNDEQFGSFPVENVHFGRTPGDRPIMGLVAAHWNDDDLSRVSPKWWDGNGIPNSTSKYKEDQKVSWHATPFEVRLEKALSEDTRKLISGTAPVVYNENEESDTASSQVQSSDFVLMKA
ncbi:hypothetical protein PHJA_001407400 [Phtheirospermum japonicum]|uniref:Protein JASON n=1 Tax=Phtheirospermum japonicum TaxID=374723 RepID=A0A830C3B0_9LAMI|nr:hypothetical protein PHJA_001407400 [Phtheirospermum japonicum]